MSAWIFLISALLVIGMIGTWIVRSRNVDLIARHEITKRKERYEGPKHLFFCLADHFEPYWSNTREDVALRRVEEWVRIYPAVVDGYRDDSGRPPQHSFFYPAEEYDPRCVAMLAELQTRNYGCVEVHLHHDRDTSEGLRQKIFTFTNVLNREHGLLHKNAGTGDIEYAFIHGMFALDNSGPGGKWCGVADEITVLKETGCYADFTFPSAPDSTQPPMLNRIYYATDDPKRPKSHHKGVDAQFGKPPRGDLLLVTGPLVIDWRRRKKGFIPAIENGAIASNNLPTPARVDLWVRTEVHIKGWPSWVFVKVHTHGAQELIAASLLKDGLKTMYSHLLRHYNDRRHFVLHFVRPREVYNCVKALESGNVAWIRKIEDFDYALPPPPAL